MVFAKTYRVAAIFAHTDGIVTVKIKTSTLLVIVCTMLGIDLVLLGIKQSAAPLERKHIITVTSE